MRTARVWHASMVGVMVANVAPLAAQVFHSEFFSDPATEGWAVILQVCNPETWNDDGWYHQRLDLCPQGSGGARDVYRRSLSQYDGAGQFFVEFRLETDGDHSEIVYAGPTVVALRNDAAVGYNITVASNLVKFFRDVDLPIPFIEVAPGIPHTYRLELQIDHYAFHIDGYLIDSGSPDGAFPVNDPRITWQGSSRELPCHNTWDYIRYGVIPDDASGDYDSDDAVGLFDYYFVHDCLTKDGPGIFAGPQQNAGPGCRFTDFDADGEGDGDADLLDFAEFQNTFTAD